ncbi:glycoside hydrolase [Mrakia frigida]|uniref:glycoside hydrolase family 71 protein n=1 Tax=Mrakia frigida TaxID=29902 RepID=UPI003FCC1A9E
MAFGFKKKEEQKSVVLAHFMLGNTYSYTPELWKRQILLAREAGIDGFSLNLGPEEWQLLQALIASSLCPPQFTLILSLDLNVLPCATTQDAQTVVSSILSFYNNLGGKHVLRYGRHQKAVLSTFGGGDASFGGIGWKGLLGLLQQRGLEVFFIPSFFLPPQAIIDNPLIDGIFAWNNGWPLTDAPLSTAEDKPFLKSDKPCMAAVSPCFFTHYGTEPPWGWNKNWIYASDENLYTTRWEQILAMKPQMVQIISWNDFGESHYIGPIEGSQPGSEAWTDGMSHEGWLELTKYFVGRFKGESKEITDEKIVFAHRPHPASMEASKDRVGRPNHSHRAKDLLSFTSLLAHPSTLTLSHTPSATLTFSLPKGYYSFTTPFVPGSYTFVVSRRLHGEEREVGRGSTSVEGGDQCFNFNFKTGVIRIC